MVMRRRGFTLVELILTMVLAAAAVAVIFQIAVLAINAKQGRTTALAVTNEAPTALFRFTREARAVRAAVDVVVANASEFRFVAFGGEDTRYWLSGTTLMRNNQSLATGVTSFALAYEDSNGATIVTPTVSPAATNIRLVTITVTATNSGRSVSYGTVARLRNVP